MNTCGGKSASARHMPSKEILEQFLTNNKISHDLWNSGNLSNYCINEIPTGLPWAKELYFDRRLMFEAGRLEIPPHPGAGIAIRGYTWVSGWYHAATEFNILKKTYSSQKQLVRCEVFLMLLRRQVGFPSLRALIFFM